MVVATNIRGFLSSLLILKADIINVNEIFKDLAVIVQEQGVVIGKTIRRVILFFWLIRNIGIFLDYVAYIT